MATLIDESKVHIEIGVRRVLQAGQAPGTAYGLRLLCNGRPLWNPALFGHHPDAASSGWLWDKALGAPPLVAGIETALAGGRWLQWETRPGGIYLSSTCIFHSSFYGMTYDRADVTVRIGGALLGQDSPPAGGGIGWRLSVAEPSMLSFAAELRKEWDQLEAGDGTAGC